MSDSAIARSDRIPLRQNIHAVIPFERQVVHLQKTRSHTKRLTFVKKGQTKHQLLLESAQKQR